MRVELSVVRRPFLRVLFLRVASFSRRPTALSLLPSFLPVASSMEGFVVSTGRSLRRGRGSLVSSSRSTGKAPATSQKRASQGSGSQRKKRQKTKSNEAPAEPLTYHEVESNSDPEPLPRQASTQTRIKIHGQWYRRSDKVAQKTKTRTKSSHIWDEGKGYTIIHKATGVRYYYCCYCLDQKKDPKYKPLSKLLCSLI